MSYISDLSNDAGYASSIGQAYREGLEEVRDKAPIGSAERLEAERQIREFQANGAAIVNAITAASLEGIRHMVGGSQDKTTPSQEGN